MVDVKTVKLGTNERKSFSKINEVLEMPNLIEIQKNSYNWFVTTGLKEIFNDMAPITSFNENLELKFIDYSIEDTPRYSIVECKARDATYAAPLKVKTRLLNKETGEIKESEIFMGDFPIMTPSATFIINGAERVVVSQLVRSPGAYYDVSIDRSGRSLYTNQVIPTRGAWLECETDQNLIVYVRIDKNRKIPVTTLLRALGLSRDTDIKNYFGDDERLDITLQKDSTSNKDEALLEIYHKLRPGEPATVEGSEQYLYSLFFDSARYDLARVGRYKYNKKLALMPRALGYTLTEPVADPMTGEVLYDAGTVITSEIGKELEKKGVSEISVEVETENGLKMSHKIHSNAMVDISDFVKFDCEALGVNEKVYFPVLMDLIRNNKKVSDLKEAIGENIHKLIPSTITIDDVFSSISYIFGLAYGIGSIDDIDHLGNRRIRCVGELLQKQFRTGMARMEKNIREKMNTQAQDVESITPQSLINTRPVAAAIREFFGSSPLSQFMDQTNPLAELTHKRRLSALGPGGLSRDRAGFEVRDVHYTHYGRMCPIETPEGPNIGLISYLATYARIDKYGFIEAPFRKVDKKTGVVLDEVVYMTADAEDGYTVAQANEPLDSKGRFARSKVSARYLDEFVEVDPSRVDFMDVSPKMVISVATSMIPFLENDDANRALMGANMQRQAVPLLKTESPVVGTGMEYKAAIDSGVVVLCERPGTVKYVDAEKVQVKTSSGQIDTYDIIKFLRSNHGTCVNQRPIVSVGQKVKKGDVIADGPATCNGEISLGKNVLIGFMTWEGYNYEDAVLINEKIVRDDVFTSIHIEEYELESRSTKLGNEDITRDIPNVGDDALKDLDERGIIRIGAEVRSNDILVGKVTPKGETEATPEDKLLRAIFGENAKEVRDTSLRVPHGQYGTVVDVKVYDKTNSLSGELSPGVNTVVRVYIAQKRKISVGDKMAGRHGNKGVVSRILPSEDMPFLPDGTPLDIVLNPLGVPSRMNIGQVLEVHLGYAAKALGWKVCTPVFDGAHESDIKECLKMAKLNTDGKTTLYDGRTGRPFDNPVTVGYMYFLKLHHLVDDKIHARATGPYSLVTQQPLGGKAQMGGQRFGEMEVWALEAYGAAYTLQEILTVKSDDVVGRVKTYEAIVRGNNVPIPGVPEAFRVLIKELQSLALDVRVLNKDGEEVDIKQVYDDDEYSEAPVVSAAPVDENGNPVMGGSYSIEDSIDNKIDGTEPSSKDSDDVDE